MKINEEEAETILSSLGDEDGEISERELKLEKRIRQEFPAIDKKLKYQEWKDYLWGVGAENDKRVIQARGELEKFKEELGLPDNQFKESGYYIALDNLMNIKRVVVRELLKE